MRTMLKVSIPVVQGNEAINDGTLGKIIEKMVAKTKPEGAYFFVSGGKRTALFFIKMEDVSQMAEIAEPFFMGLNAEVDWRPVMNGEELQKGLAAYMAHK